MYISAGNPGQACIGLHALQGLIKYQMEYRRFPMPSGLVQSVVVWTVS